MNTAAKVAQEKAAHPERFCPRPRCLWRTGGDPCPRHQPAPAAAPEPDVCKLCGRMAHPAAACDPGALEHAQLHPRPYSCSCRDCGARAAANGHVFGGGASA